MLTISEISHLVKTALSDFKRNKIRTVLTSLGIMIGVLSVCLLLALGIGLKNYLEQQFESLGANLIIIFPGNVFKEGGSGGGFGAGFAGGAEFDEKDLLSLQRKSGAEYVVPSFTKSSVIEGEDNEYLGYILGTNEEVFPVLNIEIETGETFTKSDNQARTKVAFLGNTLATELFTDTQEVVGKTIKVAGQRFKVIGVGKKKGDRESDTSAFVPYKSVEGTINVDKTFFTIYLGVESEDNVETVKENVKKTLLERYDEDEFSVTEQSEILGTVNQIFSIVNALLVAIGSISLLVGGVGIMNIMYATVTERIKEVGIRRAVGATERDILLQFLTESVLLSLIGGIGGLLLTTIIVLVVRFFFPASLNLFSVVITILISSGIGIFFGVFPARRAAKLPPIEAIRYE